MNYWQMLQYVLVLAPSSLDLEAMPEKNTEVLLNSRISEYLRSRPLADLPCPGPADCVDGSREASGRLVTMEACDRAAVGGTVGSGW